MKRVDHFAQAEALRAAGNPVAAVEAYSLVVEADPEHAEALHMRGVAYGMKDILFRGLFNAAWPRRAERIDLMRADLTEAGQLYAERQDMPAQSHVARDLGKAHYLAGDLDAAENELHASRIGFSTLKGQAESPEAARHFEAHENMSISYLGRVMMLRFAETGQERELTRAGDMMEGADGPLQQGDDRNFELYNLNTLALVRAIERKRDASEAALARMQALRSEGYGNKTHTLGMLVTQFTNRYGSLLPDTGRRALAKGMLKL